MYLKNILLDDIWKKCNTELQGKFTKSIKLTKSKLNLIKQLENNCYIPDLVPTFPEETSELNF